MAPAVTIDTSKCLDYLPLSPVVLDYEPITSAKLYH